MTTRHRLTLEAFLKRRETKPHREYYDGEVTRKTMPSIAHGIVQHLLNAIFFLYFREHPIGIAGSEIRCIMQRDGRSWAPVPDFVFVTYERLGTASLFASLQVAPDLA